MLHVFVSSPEGDLEGFVSEAEDLDGTFTLISADDGESYRVNGWCCDVEILEDAQ